MHGFSLATLALVAALGLPGCDSASPPDAASVGNLSVDPSGNDHPTPKAVLTPDDPEPIVNLKTSLGGMNLIQAPKAWQVRTNCQAIPVADLDTGTDYTHPQLAPNIWKNPKEQPNSQVDGDGNGFPGDYHGWNFTALPNGNNDPRDDHYHGTHTAGVIGAVSTGNPSDPVGICQKATIIPVKIFCDEDSCGGDNSETFTSDAIAAVAYSVKVGAKVINASWAIPAGTFSQALKDEIDAADRAGVLIVAAAGNEGANNDQVPSYPANYPSPNVISVASVNAQDQLGSDSNYGLNTVHIAAPGVGIYSTAPTYRTDGLDHYSLPSGAITISGTSMATPHVAGAAALVWSAFPNLTPEQVKQRLLSTADSVPGLKGKVGASGLRLNVYRALTDGI